MRLSIPFHQQYNVDPVGQKDIFDVPCKDKSDQVSLLQYFRYSGIWCGYFTLLIKKILLVVKMQYFCPQTIRE